MAQKVPLFNTDIVRTQLAELRRFLSRVPKDGGIQDAKAAQLDLVTHIILNNAEQFDENCQLNAGWLGSAVQSHLINLNEAKITLDLDWFLSVFYRFLVEFDLSLKNGLSSELQGFQRFVLENIDSFNSMERNQIEYARQEMPVAILKALLNDDVIVNLKNVKQYSDQVDSKFLGWKSSLETNEKTVQSLQESLNSYQTAFNFVGLFDGFNDLAIAKKKELSSNLWAMRLFGIILVSPLFFELYFVYSHQERLGTLSPYFIGATALITLSLTLLFIYFFRISVRSVDACKAQLLQIELRKTLCRFIQSYATYSKEIKDKNPESLSKFESLIFSGIVSDGEKLPSTFDGIEQVSNFIKSIRKGDA